MNSVDALFIALVSVFAVVIAFVGASVLRHKHEMNSLTDRFKQIELLAGDDTRRLATKRYILASKLAPYSPLDEFDTAEECRARIAKLSHVTLGGVPLPPPDYECFEREELAAKRKRVTP